MREREREREREAVLKKEENTDTLEENTEETCEHLCVYRGKCVSCERLAFKNVHQGMWLWLNKEEMDRIRKVESEKLLEDKKTVLVLDLDQSLIHSTEQEKYLRTPQELLQHNLRDSLFRLSPPWEKMMLKLRPSVHTFLKEASAMFEIYLCKTGTRSYALKVTEFLDPENVYFKYSRIIAREDLFETDEKSLDLVLREQRMVLALDDTKSVWRKNEVNLILVKKYHYFDSDDDLSHVSLSALETDEDETTGTLPAVLEELKVIHRLFFYPKFEAGLSHRNVGFIFTRRSVLRGCTLSFKHIFPSDFMRQNSRLWLMAEELGAKFSMDNLLYPITHMVTWFATAEEFQEAEREEFILVHPKWLRACYYAVSRVSENDYLIKPKD